MNLFWYVSLIIGGDIKLIKWQKFMLGLFSLLILIVSFYSSIRFQYTVGNPFDFSFFISNKHLLFYGSFFLFWISILLLVCSTLGLILSIVIPKKEKLLRLSSSQPNSLAIQRKTVESIILIKANEKEFFEEVTTKVKVKTKKRKITAKIFGSIQNVPNLPDQSRLFINELHEDMETILGLESEKIRLKVILKPNQKKNKTATSKKRVS